MESISFPRPNESSAKQKTSKLKGTLCNIFVVYFRQIKACTNKQKTVLYIITYFLILFTLKLKFSWTDSWGLNALKQNKMHQMLKNFINIGNMHSQFILNSCSSWQYQNDDNRNTYNSLETFAFSSIVSTNVFEIVSDI